MASFQIPIEKPSEIKPRLGKPTLHWKKGRSAFELSTAWMNADGIPMSVRAVLENAPEWQAAKFLEGIFERQTELPGKGNPSQTDLLAIVRLKDGNAILGVEGKVDEPFGHAVADWLEGKSEEKKGKRSEAERQRSKKNRGSRLDGLCRSLQVDADSVGHLFYQLFHRTYATIYEAKRFGYCRAMMLVHSFAETPELPAMPACFEEFSDFARAVGMPVAKPGGVSPAKLCDGIDLRLAWVSDLPSISA